MNSLEKIVSIILIVVLLFIIPIANALERQDDLVYNFVYEETNEFVDMIRANGYITPVQYTTFAEKIQLSGNLYDIDIDHEKLYYVPDISTPGQIIASYEGFYAYEILEQTLFNNALPKADRIYTFNKGDYIVITIVNTSQTPFEAFKGTIGRNGLNSTIYVKIGGMINNETN